NYWYLIPIFVAGGLAHYCRALRWRYLLAPIQLYPSAINTMLAVMVGYIVNLAVPRAGEVAKCTVLARYEKMPASKMLGTIVAERAFDMFCLLVITAATFLLEMERIGQFVASHLGDMPAKWQHDQGKLLLLVAAGITALLLLLLAYRLLRKSKVGKLMEEMAQGVLSIFRMQQKWQFLGYTVLIWTLYTLQVYLGFKCLEGTASLPFMAAMVVLVYGSVGIIATPGGIGAYPYLVAQILTAYPVSAVAGAAFGWISWATQTLIILILGTASLLLLQPYNNWKDGQTQLDKQ
ncbi:MAG: UPF0104 family protein, partial [Chitinophagia bacterium]|nr:UPF0104 family protein [Chitinophagia bacterium]